MVVKTYGIENLVDWKAQLKVGKARVIVHFTGGAITRFGVTPAEFSTSDPMVQHIIEQCDYFKGGRIKLLREAVVADDAETLLRKERDAKRAMRKVSEDVGKDLSDTSALPDTSDSSGLSDSSDLSDGLEVSEVTEDGVSPVTEVEVSCLQDAQEYLKEHFGVPMMSVRSYEKAQAVGAEHGVVFVGAKF